MKKSSLVINEPPLLVLPSLAKAIGLNEAIIIQQLHYWMENPKAGVYRDGEKWVFNTYEEWQDNFPFWSVNQIQRTFLSLEKAELVIARQLDIHKHDAKKFYRINYDMLCMIDDANLSLSIVTNSHDDNSNTETTPETTQAMVAKEKTRKIVNSSNLKVDAILENELKASSKSWSNVPEQFIPYCKAFCESTTLKYSKKNFNEWVSTFSDWMDEGYTPDMITDAVNQICSDPRPTAIVRPSSIEWKLKDMKVKRANNPHRTVYVNVPDKTSTGLSPEEYERWKQTRVSV